jgi:hypothetical protein
MTDQRAEEFARCAVTLALALQETHDDGDPFEGGSATPEDSFAPALAGREAIFDQALSNGLSAIVAHEWPGEDLYKKNGKTLSASDLLKVIAAHVPQDAATGVHVIRDPADIQEQREHGPEAASEPIPKGTEGSIFQFERPALPALDTRVDVRVLEDSLGASQPARHGGGEGCLQRRHIAALLALDDHISLRNVEEAHADRGWDRARNEDRRSASQAVALLALIGDDEAGHRAEAAENPNAYHPKHNPDGHAFDSCPVCGHDTFCVQGLGIWGDVGFGQCAVCSYIRSPQTADDEGFREHVALISDRK